MLVKRDTMRDISLLMASVLTTGQTNVPELPQELPELRENTQQQLRQDREIKVAPSTEITPPEFVESEKNLELTKEECNYSGCDVSKQSQTSGNSSQERESSDFLQFPQAVITLKEKNIKHQKILENSRNKIQFKDSVSLTQDKQFNIKKQKISPSSASINSEASQSSVRILLPNKPILLQKELDKQENIPKLTQKFEPEFNTDAEELQNQNTLFNSEPIESTNPMSQVTSVSELDDVNPTDWAFDALQSLANRHNCALGYQDGTFRGNKAIDRYQFATGIDACLQKINELIARKGESIVDEQDLIILQRLQNEFRAELNQLQERIISLEERTGELKANQFSPTTRFFGQATTSLQGTNTNEVDLFPRDGVPERTAETNLTFTNSMQITLATSFTGRDLLLTGLYAGNLGSSASSLFTNMGTFEF